MKVKVFTAALVAILLSVVFPGTAEAQGRGHYNRGGGYARQYAPGPHYNNYYGNGGYYNRGAYCAPRTYVRAYAAPAYYGGGGYYSNGYGGGYATTTITYSNGGNCNNGYGRGYYNNNGYYNNGYNNGGYYNNGGNCGNGYRHHRRGW